MLSKKTKRVKHHTSLGKWHTVRVHVVGDELKVSIDEKLVASFQSIGFAHPTKKTLRLSVPREAWVDDLKIYRLEQ